MKKTISTVLGACIIAFGSGAMAQNTAPQGENSAPSTPTRTASSGPSQAVQQALDKRMRTVLSSLEGVGAALSADMFSDEFSAQAKPEQVQQALKQLHDGVGACKLAGRIRANAPNGTSYLLDCQKAFVPVDIGVEDKAPHRIQSLFFGASYWRM